MTMFGLDPPRIVKDAIAQAVKPDVDVVMSYAAWRVLKTLRESVEQSKNIKTADDVLVVLSSLEDTYESLYLAAC